MIDRQALFEKFLTVLQTPPPLPEYLGEKPESVTDFDPYQMVAEWIALRHELKQQGKLFQVSQNTLQIALEELQSDKIYLQEQLAISQSQALSQEVSQADRKTLWRDLIGVVDALDRACNHWQSQIEDLDRAQLSSANHPQSFWQRWVQQWTQSDRDQAIPSTSSLGDVRDVLVSDQQGIDLIRRSLLDVLRQRQVVPIAAQGKPFDSKIMYAIGRQVTTEFPENTVMQEVVRGYMWESQILREAQVIVAVK
jgi:molecular chaperone GrpE